MRNSSSFRDQFLSSWWVVLLAFSLSLSTFTCFASNVANPGGRYSSRQWGAEEGLQGGTIRSIAQTPDGYLWVGTDAGLLRFDGFQFKTIYQPNHEAIDRILSLAVDSEGALWIRCDPNRLLRYANGSFTTHLSSSQESFITAVGLAQPRGLWMAGLNLGLVHIDSAGQSQLSPSNSMILTVAQTSDGRVWTGTRESGLYVLGSGGRTRITENIPNNKVNCLLAIPQNQMWIGTDDGLAFWDGKTARQIPPPSPKQHIQIFAIVMDDDAGLWVGTSDGLLLYQTNENRWVPTEFVHQHAAVTSLMKDREGNLWFGSGANLIRIRADQLETFDGTSFQPSLSELGAVYVDAHRRVWIAPLKGGLYWFNRGIWHAVSVDGLDRDTVYSIDGRGNDIWLGRKNGGITRLSETSKGFEYRDWTDLDGLAQNSTYVVHASYDGTVWAGSLTNGVSKLTVDGRIKRFSKGDGLRADSVTAIAESDDGTIWFGTPNGLCSLRREKWSYFGLTEGLANVEIDSLSIDPVGGLWIGTASGLAYLSPQTGRIRSVHEPPFLNQPVYGLAVQGSESLLVATENNILRVSRQAILGGRSLQGLVHSYGQSDGLVRTHGVRRSSSVVRDATGDVWFTSDSGLSVASATNQSSIIFPQPSLDGAVADDARLNISSGVVVPPGTRRLTLGYTGIQLRSPELVRFRYRLVGFDKSWSEVTSAREAVYTNLRPGAYKFLLQAGDSDGNWNSRQISTPVVVSPLLWQRWQFIAVVCCLLAMLAGWIIRLRTQHVVTEAKLRAEGRIAERTRIARELHDTLLQGFIGSLMHLNNASEELQESSETRQKLERVMNIMEKVIDEGRSAVEGLRSRSDQYGDLHLALEKTLKELQEVAQCEHRIKVVGAPRTLDPAVVPDIIAIGLEAITNAMRHAHALLVTVEIRHLTTRLELFISDDGCGMEEETLRSGRAKHWGLAGMRERAKRIAGDLTIESRQGSGTRVLLTVPASKAYTKPRRSLHRV